MLRRAPRNGRCKPDVSKPASALRVRQVDASDIPRHELFRSELRAHLKGHSEALEDPAVEILARGISVRDTEDAFRDETGRLLLSKTAVSKLGERLWADYQEFSQRDLSEYDMTHRRATRTTNLLERLFLEERRRLKIIPNACGEKAPSS